MKFARSVQQFLLKWLVKSVIIGVCIDSIQVQAQIFKKRQKTERTNIMLTFEKVLEVFQDYLTKDSMYEIVTTSRGYTVLEWDSQLEDWTDEKPHAL